MVGTGLNDIARLLLTSVNSSIRLKYLDEWLNLYCETFNSNLNKQLKKKKYKYTTELVRKLFHFEYNSQLLFAFAYLADLYEKIGEKLENKITCDSLRTSILGRIVQGFEAIYTDFKK